MKMTEGSDQELNKLIDDASDAHKPSSQDLAAIRDAAARDRHLSCVEVGGKPVRPWRMVAAACLLPGACLATTRGMSVDRLGPAWLRPTACLGPAWLLLGAYL